MGTGKKKRCYRSIGQTWQTLKADECFSYLWTVALIQSCRPLFFACLKVKTRKKRISSGQLNTLTSTNNRPECHSAIVKWGVPPKCRRTSFSPTGKDVHHRIISVPVRSCRPRSPVMPRYEIRPRGRQRQVSPQQGRTSAFRGKTKATPLQTSTRCR